MGEIIQETFNDISLERDPKIWQSYRQDVAMTEKRINFLAEFEETLFVKVNLHIILPQAYLMRPFSGSRFLQKSMQKKYWTFKCLGSKV